MDKKTLKKGVKYPAESLGFKFIGAEVDESTYSEFQMSAVKDGRSVSSLLRQVIKKFLREGVKHPADSRTKNA